MSRGWDLLVSGSTCSPSLYGRRGCTRACVAGCCVLFCLRRRARGLLCESFGRDVSGGPCLVAGRGCSADRVLEHIGELGGGCVVASVTLRLYDPFQRRLYHALLEAGWRVAGFLYPRLLFLRRYSGPEVYIARGMNKKARNRWRLFCREGGRVEPVDDVVAVAGDLYRALVSEPVRQGRPIPRSWRSPGAVARIARGMTEGVRRASPGLEAPSWVGGLWGSCMRL